MKIHRAYKTELDTNNVQRTALGRHAGAARFVYNWAVAEKKAAMEAKQKVPNYVVLDKRFNALKPTLCPWILELSSRVPQQALRDADRAFADFFRRCREKKAGRLKDKVGFPKFRSRKRGHSSFRMNCITVRAFDAHVQLPKIGLLRLKQHGYLPTDKKLLNATVSEKAGRWFVSVLVEEEIVAPKKDQASIGVDLGINTLATCSDGQTFENPKALGRSLKKLRRLSKRHKRKQEGSNNRRKATQKLAKLHYRIACVRKDAQHKMTTHLTRTKSKIVIEDLNVRGMQARRSAHDVGFYEIRRQLTYKGAWRGCEIVVADMWFPSSKRCSVCGTVKEFLPRDDRTFHCESCGHTEDRDLNAAKNLENYGQADRM